MTALETVLAQALQLSDNERGDLAARLLRSLEPKDGEEATGEEWQIAWSGEIDRRVHEVNEGSAELIDGEQVTREAQAWLESRRA